MAWSSFKSTMLGVMNNHTHGKDFDKFAKELANAYDLAIKAGKTTVTSIPLQKGNKSGMESQLKSLLQQTQNSKSTRLLAIIGPAVLTYWSGATLMQIPPNIPCPGATKNISVTAAPVLSPGAWSPIDIPPNNNSKQWVDAFCAAATIHLTTVSGLHNCICIYPGSPPPVAPGVLPWTGYTAG